MDFQNKLQTMQNDDFLLKALQFNQATTFKESIYIFVLAIANKLTVYTCSEMISANKAKISVQHTRTW